MSVQMARFLYRRAQDVVDREQEGWEMPVSRSDVVELLRTQYAAERPLRGVWSRYTIRRALRLLGEPQEAIQDLCLGCGELKNNGVVHGMSEFGGCV